MHNRVQFLRVPHGERSRDALVRKPASHGHHGNTSILDLHHTKFGDLWRVKSTLTLREAKRIVSVVSRDGVLVIPLTLPSSELEKTSSKEDLNPSGSGNHGEGIEGFGVGNVREGDAGGGRKKPVLRRVWVECIGSAGAEVQGHVDSPLLDHVSNGSNHGNATVLNLSILPPLDTVFVGIPNDPGAQWRAFVAGLDRDTEGLVDQSILGNGNPWGLVGGGERRSGGEEGEEGGGFHHLGDLFVSCGMKGEKIRRQSSLP
mmetsp:Transcript_23781/g.36170  ORF Transcript_23781/g.36170 Transcript_23781/m.36170 type:complete len:259 (+) Transcript_23781:295-1071(+)